MTTEQLNSTTKDQNILAEIGLAAVEEREKELAYGRARNEAQSYFQQNGIASKKLIRKIDKLTAPYVDAANRCDELIDAYLSRKDG